MKYRNEVTKQLDLKAAEIDAVCKKNADDRITKARVIAQKEVENYKEDLEKIENKKADNLKKHYEENHTAWEKQMLENIIGK